MAMLALFRLILEKIPITHRLKYPDIFLGGGFWPLAGVDF